MRLANAAQVASALMFLVRREQGRLAELEAGLKSLVYQYPDVSVWRASLAWLYAELGRAAEARVQFDGLAGDGLARIRRDLTWPYTMACLAEACVVSGAAEDAVPLYDALLPYAHRNVVAGPFYYLGPVAYYLGLLATQLQRWDDAGQHFEDATRQIEAFAARPHLARLLCAQARMRLARAAVGDREAAAQEVEHALAIARPLGMQALCERLDALRADVGRGAVPAPAASAVLRREGDFWTLAHAGKVSRLRDSKGLRYLARLLAEPGREFHVLDLAAANGAQVGDGQAATLRQGPADAVRPERRLRDRPRQSTCGLRAPGISPAGEDKGGARCDREVLEASIDRACRRTSGPSSCCVTWRVSAPRRLRRALRSGRRR